MYIVPKFPVHYGILRATS